MSHSSRRYVSLLSLFHLLAVAAVAAVGSSLAGCAEATTDRVTHVGSYADARDDWRDHSSRMGRVSVR